MYIDITQVDDSMDVLVTYSVHTISIEDAVEMNQLGEINSILDLARACGKIKRQTFRLEVPKNTKRRETCDTADGKWRCLSFDTFDDRYLNQTNK